MNTKQLEYFVKTSQFKSINEASAALYISQPSLSYALKSLEEELGFKLFHRSLNGIELTNNGKIILEDSKKILSIVNNWDSLLENKGDPEEIIIEGSGVVADVVIPYIISTYKQQYANVTLTAHEKIASQMIIKHPSLEDDSIILFGFFSADEVDMIIETSSENGWMHKILQTGNSYVFLNSNCPLIKKEKISIEDLKRECIAAVDVPPIPMERAKYFKFFNQFREQQLIHSPSREATLKLVSISENIITMGSFLSAKHNEYVKSGAITPIQLTDFSMSSVLIAFYTSKGNKKHIDNIIKITKELVLS